MNNFEKRNIGIDIIKAISLILIISYHLYEFNGTYIGVILFFVISGYFITSILVERDEKYFSFIKKRIYKIYPLLLVVLTFTVGLFYLFNGFLSYKMLYSSLSALFGVSNFYQIFDKLSYFERSGDVYPLLHTWSLSIEIQFYLVFPFVVYYLKKLNLGNKKNAGILFSLSIFSALIMCYKYTVGYDINALYYSTDTRIFSLLVGGGYYFAFKDREIDIKKFNILTYISLAVIIFSIFYLNYFDKLNYIGFLYIISILSGIIIISVIKGNFLKYDNQFLKNLSTLGKHSYCYYLWQYPIMIFSEEYFKWTAIKYNYTVLIQLIILIIISEISYIFLEERIDMAKKIGRLFLGIYLISIVFLPLSEETNSKIIENRVDEVNIEMQIKKINTEIKNEFENFDKNTENIDEFEKRLLGNMEDTQEKKTEKPIENKITEDKKIIEDKQVDNKKDTKIKNEIKVTEKKEDTKKIIKIEKTSEIKSTFIGDSVMKMGEPYIKAIFKNSYIDAKVSRQFISLPKILEKLKNDNLLNDVVVIHLGSNGVMNKDSFDKSMKLLKDKKVFFINCVVPKFWEETINKNLKEWSKNYENVKIIDWYKKAKGKKELFYKDATHPKPDGAKKYAEFIYENIDSSYKNLK